MTTEPTEPEVQRWSHEHPTECIPVRYDEGDWVKHADHVAALRACEARVREETQQEFRGFAEAAWAKALAAAWLAVDNTRTGFLMAIGASPEPPERYWIPKDDALAAIDALRGES